MTLHLRDTTKPWNSRWGGGIDLPRPGNRFAPTLGSSTKIPVRDGHITRLRVEIPSDFETAVQQLVDSVQDPDEFEKAVGDNNPFIREADIMVIGTEPESRSIGGMF